MTYVVDAGVIGVGKIPNKGTKTSTPKNHPMHLIDGGGVEVSSILEMKET